MPNQKISELTAIVTVDTSLDVLPIVDTSANTTKKISPTALKTALALDNVNNTSDANKPVSTAQQDALNAKVTGNTAIVAATKTKITYDAKGLVTAGNVLDAADMPMAINAANIGTGVVSSTEFGYLDGVTSAIQTQLDAKQATLVSATNIKTINSTSLLGSGDISISATPSGVAGAIQFSNGSAFASDAANLFWDDTNNRLGIGTNTPTSPLQVAGTITTQNLYSSGVIYGPSFWLQSDGTMALGQQSAGGGKLFIKGSGSTSATTSLLVQNSAGTEMFRVRDDKKVVINNNGVLDITYDLNIIGTSGADCGILINSYGTSAQASLVLQHSNANYFKITSDRSTEKNTFFSKGIATMTLDAVGNVGIGTTSPNASSLLDITSTTKGVLFPRMTTTQKNAIATPAAGLVVYDSTTNKLCCYNGSTWNDLF